MKKAAEQGYADAERDLGNCYRSGDGIEKQAEKAVYWYERAAKQGDAEAQFYLALVYLEGEGVEQNEKKAYDTSVPLNISLK